MVKGHFFKVREVGGNNEKQIISSWFKFSDRFVN